jgi:hypothetical protein
MNGLIMRWYFAVMVSLLTIGSAYAQQDIVANAPIPKAEQVISSVTYDFASDGASDRALLVEGDNAADLYIYQSVDDPVSHQSTLKLVFYKKEAAYSGGVFGQLPSLEVNGRGSLKIKSENISIGRNRWTEVLTIGYRSNQFMVLGVTYTAYDTLDPNAFSDCDLNLASGKGVRKGKPFAAGLQPVPLANWSEDQLPKACRE